MKHKKIASFAFLLFFISYCTIVGEENSYEFSSVFLSSYNGDNQEYIVLPNEIAQFIIAMFEDAENKVKEFPQELVSCYKKLLKNEPLLPLSDLAKSLPTMFNYLEQITSKTDKAPRPFNFSIVGPSVENSSLIIAFLRKLQQQLSLCCSSITSEFQQTWTILGNLNSLCNAISITEPMLITQPGYYCLANDINNTLTIAAENVTVDLNHHTISAPGTTGIYVNGAINALITNGTIDTANNGLELNNTATSQFTNLAIINCSNAGIQLDTVGMALIFKDIILDTINNYGIGTFGLIDSILQNVIIRNCDSFGIILGSSTNCTYDSCQIVDCLNSGGEAFFVNNSKASQFINCMVKNCAFTTGFDTGGDTIIENCSVIDLISNGGSTIAFSIGSGSSNTQLRNCSAINIQAKNTTAGASAIGFYINGANTVLENCLVITCSSFANFNLTAGFYVNDFNAVLLNCQASQSAGYGFLNQPGIATIFRDCLASFNSIDGFFLNDTTPSLENCSSYNNSGVGFNVASGGTITMTSCFASHNTTNYINAPNVQPANTAGAFANSFI